ncbi:META domain-containing protein [Flavobacteriaceae bacterium 3-367]|uniref:META domain-containing protein n=1 Tax=Eudoraea algarum TaxID=3417568 RepID=UPI0032908B32
MKTRILVLVCLFWAFNACDTDVNSPPLLFGAPTLSGEWHVVAIHNSSPQGPTSAPLEGEIISIVFDGVDSFVGSTSANDFAGDYAIQNNVLSFTGLLSTDALDTAYGTIFFDAMDASVNSTTNNQEFALSFANGQLTLTYADFRFLTLEKQ